MGAATVNENEEELQTIPDSRWPEHIFIRWSSMTWYQFGSVYNL